MQATPVDQKKFHINFGNLCLQIKGNEQQYIIQ